MGQIYTPAKEASRPGEATPKHRPLEDLEENETQDRSRRRDKRQSFLLYTTLRLRNSMNCLLLESCHGSEVDSPTPRRGGAGSPVWGLLPSASRLGFSTKVRECMRSRITLHLCLTLWWPGVVSGLVITEVHYHPHPLRDTEQSLEFVELCNDNTTPEDLVCCFFAEGISFLLPDEFLLAATSTATAVTTLVTRF